MFCLLKVNASAWAEEAVRSCGASDAEIKLHHDLSFGIFMDENAPVVIKEALSWMDRTIKKVEEEEYLYVRRPSPTLAIIACAKHD